jgi:hypothetical protein
VLAGSSSHTARGPGRVIANQNFFSAIRSNFRSKSLTGILRIEKNLETGDLCRVWRGQLRASRIAARGPGQRTVRQLPTRVQECESVPAIEL